MQHEKICIFILADIAFRGYHKSFLAVSPSSPLHVSNQKGRKLCLRMLSAMRHETLASSCFSGETPSEHKHTTSGGGVSVLELWGMWSHYFITITPGPTVTQSRSPSIYGLNRSVWKLSLLDRNTWNHIAAQIICIKIDSWWYNCLQIIIMIRYVKPHNSVVDQ